VSYPAFTSFFADPERTTARVCVYMALQPPFLSHAVPRDVKIEVIRRSARISTRAAVDAIAWLIARGYAVVHHRDARGTPSLSLAWAIEPAAARFPACTRPSPLSAGVAHTPEQ
jgi:hypothetical protein